MKDAEFFVSEPKKNTYTYIFQASMSEPNGRLNLANKKSGTKVWVDDVSLVPVEVTYDDPKERSQLFINPSDNPKTIALTANYWDIDQNEVSGSITLAPWTSKILIKKDNAPCGVNHLPTVSLTAPVGGASFTTGSTVNLTATATDQDGQVVKVEFFQGNVKLGESTTSPYSFAWVNPPAGNYQLSARVTDHKEGTKVSNLVSITVTGAVAPTYTVTFTVKDAANALVSGVFVTFKGQTVASNVSGVATFTNVTPGSNLAYNATKTGFNPATGTVNVVSANVAHNIVLSAVGSPSYTVTFTVKDAANALVSGASVTFKGQTIASNDSGVATFTNVVSGTNLPYTASKTGLNTYTGTLNVASANVSQNILMTAVGTPTYSVTFTVKDAENVLLADALVSFNEQTITTTASGEAVFNSVAPGTNLPYSVSKAGFDPATGVLSIAAANVAQSVVLSPSTITQPEPNPVPEPVAQLNPRNIFSPNGDGINEMWEVEGIEQQAELQVRIFNKYGQQVYQAQPYTNSWDGGGLPDGVYYFQIQNQEGKSIKKGAITLVR